MVFRLFSGVIASGFSPSAPCQARCSWRTVCYTIFIVAILVVSSSCSRNHKDNIVVGRLHPTEENIPVITDMQYVLREDTSGAQFKLVHAENFLEAEVFSVGAYEGEHHEMLGTIIDVAAGDNTLLYIDGEYEEVRVYDQQGTLKQVIGAPGVAPGEFSYLEAVAITSDASKFFVADQAGTRIQIFQRRDNAYEFLDVFSMPHEFFATDICVIRDHLYLHGYSESLDLVIHKVTHEGEYILSFGQPYLSDVPFIKSLISDDGSLVCSETFDTVLYANQTVPILKAYDEGGTLRWQVKFGDHAQMYKPEGRNRGRPSLRYPPQLPGESSFLFLTTDPVSNSFIISYTTIGPEEEERAERVRHYFSVPAESGHGTYLGQHYLGTLERGQLRNPAHPPRIVSLNENYAYAVRHSPFPKIGVFERDLLFRR